MATPSVPRNEEERRKPRHKPTEKEANVNVDEQRIERLAFALYSEVYGHIDDKRHKALHVGEICDWLINGDGGSGRSLGDLVEEWREYTAGEDNTMNESNWHHCVDCGAELGPAPGADGSGAQRGGVTFCHRCGAMYRWDFWRLNRYRGDTGSIYEPRLERHGARR